MATFNEVAAFQSLLQRKALVGALLVAPASESALTAITTTGGSLAPLTGYSSLGKLTSDGVEFGNDIEKQEQKGFGDAYPSRIDVVSENATLNFTAMETKRQVLEIMQNVDLSTVTASATTGELTWDKPLVPELQDWRVLALFRDVNKSNGLDIYLGVHFLRSNITQNGAQTFANNETGLVYPATAQAMPDDDEGTAQRFFWGGPGLAGILTDMGFTAGV